MQKDNENELKLLYHNYILTCLMFKTKPLTPNIQQ